MRAFRHRRMFRPPCLLPRNERRAVRHVQVDVNFWKSFAHARLSTAVGGRGAVVLHGGNRDHGLLAEHLLAEYRVRTHGRGRVVEEWKARPGRPDDHWLDGLVGCCCCAGAMQGCSLPEQPPRPASPKVRHASLREMQARRKFHAPRRPT